MYWFHYSAEKYNDIIKKTIFKEESESNVYY